ncbi:MAG: AAA family ATPase, partial [Rhodobacteraceae bacterium]|nr:AAA family ATPase [Paracoccaceae bacterium]
MMRLNKLILLRYGMFTDRVLDFGEGCDDERDLHVIYGANEAGKSTALSAWLDFLYGIKRTSPYKFQHKTATAVAALLDTNELALDLSRSTATRNSLKSSNGIQTPELELRKHLSGLDRNGYEAIFSVNVDTLQQGGEEILASKGDLGRLLFSASAGLPDLTNRLESIKSAAREFYKPRGRIQRLNALKKEMADLDTRWRELDTGASEFQRLRASLAETERNLKECRKLHSQRQLEVSRKQRIIDQVPHAQRLQDIRRELEPLAALKSPP